MPHFKCYPPSDPEAQWLYCPSFGAAIAYSALFGLVTITHIIQAFVYRKPFGLVIIMGAAWETAGYIFRALSVTSQLDETYATAQQLLILLSPLWINAFVYMVLGRMIHFFLTHDDRVFGVKARKITLIFVLFDISAFMVQVTGGLMTVPSASPSTQRTGLHVYMGGVGIQLFFIMVFIALAVRFQILLRRQQQQQQHQDFSQPSEATYTISADGPNSGYNSPRHATPLMVTIYIVLTLIIYRNIYRLIEFSSGVDSSITMREWYMFVFDSTPMLLALLVFNLFHPGRKLRGPNCDFSEETKAMKMAKRQKKAAKKEAKVARKEAKKNFEADRKEEKETRKAGKERQEEYAV